MNNKLAARMVDIIEHLLVERRALRATFHLLQHRLPPLSQFDSLVEKATTNPTILENVRKEVAPLRAGIEGGGDLEHALDEFLRGAPEDETES